MSDTETQPKPRVLLPLLAGLVLALALGGGSFVAVYSGLLPVGGAVTGPPAADAAGAGKAAESVAFVELAPLLVSVQGSRPARQLRLEAHLEVTAGAADEVARLMPRIMDVMNSYLRAIEMADLRDPAALMRVRAQMLRRIQVVTGEGRVRDLLVTTFLIS